MAIESLEYLQPMLSDKSPPTIGDIIAPKATNALKIPEALSLS